MKFTIENMRKGSWGKLIAFFDIKFTGFTSHFDMTVKGFKIVEGTKGKFVGMPSQKGNDDEYHDTIFADKETRVIINNAAIKHYDNDSEVIEEKTTEELIAAGNDDLPF